ncbi:MAG: coenzyme F420-0:L-glutamate ligase [Firmicutes bacterium]|nr:coenzyme F420-0:L-glutamate ligase [Bacillota bacterium]
MALVNAPPTPPLHEDGVGEWLALPAKTWNEQLYDRFAVKTHLILMGEDLEQTLRPYLEERVTTADIIVLSEKAVAIAECRAVRLVDVHPSRFARFLSRRVRQLGYGLGLRRPETMEMALREAGWLRIFVAAIAGAFDHLTGQSGHFYKIAGRKVAAIDGPGPTTIAPYNQYIVLAPLKGRCLSQKLHQQLRVGVAVIDVNDVGSEVLSASDGVDIEQVRCLMKDNPLGQGSEQTPLGVLRPHHDQ